MTLLSYVKNIFWIAVLLALAPPCISIIKEQYRDFVTPRHKIGIFSINGPLTTAQPFIKHLNSFFKDKNIKGILMLIECKGGATGSAQMIFNEIEHLKKQYPKPITALVENVCTQEGYLIASIADTIIASGAALIGSIKSSTEYTQSINDDIYNQLVTAIAHKRKLSTKEPATWANGQLFTGNQAYKLHLIDKVGCTADAQAILKEKALIDGEIQWVCATQENNFLESIKNYLTQL